MVGWPSWLGSLKRNKGLKLLALLLAIVAWVAVGSEERTEASIQLGLELVNIPKHLLVTNEIPTHIEVQVQGPRSVVRELSVERPRKQIDLSRAVPGTMTIPLSPGSLNLPRGIVVSRIRPNSLTITLDEALTKKVTVQPVLSGAPAAGFEVSEVHLSPAEVPLTGPKKILQQLKAVQTLPIDISNLNSSLTRNVELDFQNQPLTYADSQSVVAKVTIRPKLQSRLISNVPVQPLSAGGKVRVAPARVTITVRGPQTNMELLRPGDLQATVDVRGLRPGRYQVPVTVTLPAGLELQKVSPPTVTVIVPRGRGT